MRSPATTSSTTQTEIETGIKIETSTATEIEIETSTATGIITATVVATRIATTCATIAFTASTAETTTIGMEVEVEADTLDGTNATAITNRIGSANNASTTASIVVAIGAGTGGSSCSRTTCLSCANARM